jgi:hypothetical protein
MAQRSTTPVNQMIKPATECPGAPTRKRISTPEDLCVEPIPFNGDFSDPKVCPGAPKKNSSFPRTLEEYGKKIDFEKSLDSSTTVQKKARIASDRPSFME